MPRFVSVAWTLLFSLLFLLFLATPSVAQEEKRHYKIGLVLDSEVDQKVEEEVLSAVTDVFVSSKRFTMIERYKLEALFTERELPQFLDKGGQTLSDFLGIDLLGLVVYSIETKDGKAEREVARVVLDVRLVEVTTGIILETLSSERPYSPPVLTIREAGNYLSESLREKFPLSGYVVKVKGKEVAVDLGGDHGLKEGAALKVVRKGEQIVHPIDHVLLPAEWDVAGELEVVFVSPRLSICWLRWGDGIEPGSQVFLREEFSPLISLTEPKDNPSDSAPPSECTGKEKKSHVIDWLRRLFTGSTRFRCRAVGSASLL